MSILLRPIITFAVLVFAIYSHAQRTCGTDSVHAHMMGLPGYENEFRAKQDAVNDALINVASRSECDEPLIIPVAVHFQNTGIPMDCAIEMALSQVETLNQDFAATNPDISEWTDQQPTLWPGISNAESCICFCLATLNHPAGFGLSDGDYAITLDQTTGDNDAAWAGYLNFFVRTIGGGTLGYSPLGGSGNGDGVTCDPAYFGTVSCGGNTVNPPFDLGRTMTHEVGHYLLLEHPWAAGGCGSDDLVADTPVTDNPQFGCPSGQSIVNCTAPILWPTYMEYCDDACLFMFSAGQVSRMETYVTQNLQNLLTNSVTTCQETVCLDFEVELSSSDESCTGNDGVINAIASGGAEPYSYSIDGGANLGAVSTFNGLTEGSYEVFVTDQNDCEFTATVSLVREGPDLELAQFANEYCSDGSGLIEIVANEVSAFEFSIDDGATWSESGLYENLNGGDYLILAQNTSGCSGELSIELLNESDLEIDIESQKDVSCTWFDNGEIILKAVGGDEPYIYVLDESQEASDGNFGDLPVGEHFVYVEDAVGCTLNYQFELGFDFSQLGDDCPCTFYVPNAITPDGNDRNEVLEIAASCPFTDFHLEIYDRWGFKLFETSDPDFKWNGGYQGYYVQSDVYVYQLSYTWGEGNNTAVEPIIQTGMITVVR